MSALDAPARLSGPELQNKFDDSIQGASVFLIKPTTPQQAVAMIGPELAVPESGPAPVQPVNTSLSTKLTV
jgi:hypothetical protein